MAFDNDIGNKNHEMVFIKHPLCVKLWNGHHITLIWQKKFNKWSIDEDILYDDNDGHKDNEHDNPSDYGDNDKFTINIIIIIIMIINIKVIINIKILINVKNNKP